MSEPVGDEIVRCGRVAERHGLGRFCVCVRMPASIVSGGERTEHQHMCLCGSSWTWGPDGRFRPITRPGGAMVRENVRRVPGTNPFMPPGRIDFGIERSDSLYERNNFRLFAEDFAGTIFDLSIPPLPVMPKIVWGGPPPTVIPPEGILHIPDALLPTTQETP